MHFKFGVFLLAVLPLGVARAQNAKVIEPAQWQHFSDSVVSRVHPSYDQVNGIHRWLFGENYRKDWAMPVKLPVLHLSQINGGLKLVKEGGGMESKALRLADNSGREWVLRSVEKTPDKLLPENLQGTFAVDWVGDEFSGQHPYSALIVPPLAEAVHVPHANPVIGVVADDPALGPYRKLFSGMICLLEEREPAGPSDNTIKMEKELVKSYDNRIDGELFLRARMLDLLIGDWDRHEDQWRWAVDKNGKSRFYNAVPRDRDQVFHLNQGLFPSIAALPWIDPTLDNFDGNIPHVKYSLWKTRFIKNFPDAQFSYDRWMKVANEFVKLETDEVLEAGLRRLPRESYLLRHEELLKKLKERRDHIPAAMADYYRFINKIVDIRTTDKSEQITITDAPEKGMRITVRRPGNNELTPPPVMDMVYLPEITKEIRFYTSAGNDHILINTPASSIKLRIIDSAGYKTFDVQQSNRKVLIYAQPDSVKFSGNTGRISPRLSADTANGKFVITNRYNIWAPLATAGLNADDGFLLGLGFRFTGVNGFRKLPYSSRQELMLTHSFATDAFRLNYHGEWIQAVSKADLLADVNIQAPDNTMNFFGRGNETMLNKTGDYHRYYRTRFDTYEASTSLRWHTGKSSTVSVGPSIQFYHMDVSGNVGRLASNPGLIHAYDSSTLGNDKAHAGIVANYISNQKDNLMLPTKGYLLSIGFKAYQGLNIYSRSFAQLRPEFTFYQKLDSAANIVLSDRIGGGISIGSPAFYQSMFLGGQGNLLGYLQNRFAGQDMIYNNLQGRLKIANIAGYILPGQLGLTGFYDVGRVWVNNEKSSKLHQGVGGGLYFSPASLTVIQVLAGHSEEGWYPYISMNFRL